MLNCKKIHKLKTTKKQKIKLKEFNYRIDIDYDDTTKLDLDKKLYAIAINNGLTRNDEETAEKALEQIKKFTKLLALRDQECKESRGYFPEELDEYYYIYWDSYIYTKYKVNSIKNKMCINIIPFKTKEDAKKICDILNSGKFNLEG